MMLPVELAEMRTLIFVLVLLASGINRPLSILTLIVVSSTLLVRLLLSRSVASASPYIHIDLMSRSVNLNSTFAAIVVDSHDLHYVFEVVSPVARK